MPCFKVAPENVEEMVKRIERDGQSVTYALNLDESVLLFTTHRPDVIEKRGAA